MTSMNSSHLSLDLLAFTFPEELTASNGLVRVNGACNSGSEVAISGDIQIPIAVDCINGKFVADVTLKSPDGIKSVRVTQSGSSRANATSRSFMLDTVAPTIRNLTPTNGASSGASLVIQGQCEVGLNVDLKEGNLAPVRVPCSEEGLYATTLTLRSSDGPVAISISQTDKAFNAGSTVLNIVKDTLAPTVRFSSPAASTTVSSPFRVSGTCEVGVPVRVFGGRVQAPVTTTCSSGTFAVDVVLMPVSGSFNLEVEQIDSSGNRGSDVRMLSFNSNGPMVAFISPAAESFVLNSVNVTGSCESGLTVHFSGQGVAANSSTACTNGSFASTLAISSGDGSKNIVASQVNSSNISGATSRNFTKDTIGPVLSWASPVQGVASRSNLQLVGTCESGINVVASGTGVASSVSGACSNGAFSFQITLSSPDGTKTINLSQTDLAGNVTSLTRTFMRDTVAPALTFTSPAAGTTADLGLRISGTCENGLIVNVSGSGVASPMQSNCAGAVFSADITFSSTDGDKIVMISQTDGAGNTGSASRTFKREAPIVMDGPMLYANNCASCHGALASSTKRGRTTDVIANSIATVPAMSQVPALVALNSTQIGLIATALGLGPTVPASTGSGPTLVRRLSNLEYRNSLTDAISYQFSRQNSNLGSSIINKIATDGLFATLPNENSSLRLGTVELASKTMSSDRFSAYLSIAHAVAREITAQSSTLQAFAGTCATSNTAITNNTCLNNFINNFGLIVFRTPPKPAELAELKQGISSWTDLIGRLLVHPRFLTHYEREGTLTNRIYRLTAYELSARLASVFWKSVPDLNGLNAASSGAILTDSGLRAEVNRLLASPKARETMWSFYREWLAVSRLPTAYDTGLTARASASPISVDSMNASGFKEAVLQDGRDLLEYYTWQTSGKLEDIFRSTLIFTTNSTLASIYGVSPRASSSAAPVNDTSGRHTGILSRAIITHQKPSHDGSPNHVMRGVFLLSNLMGTQLGLPANFAEQQALATQVPTDASSRTEVTILTSPNACMSCHSSINPSGFAMANFDWVGRFITTERRYKINSNSGQAVQVANNPVDANTTLTLNGTSYSISGVPSFVTAMANSGKLFDGFSRYYFRFAFGRMEDPTEDRALVEQMNQGLKTQSIRDVLLNFATHSDFAKAQGDR